MKMARRGYEHLSIGAFVKKTKLLLMGVNILGIEHCLPVFWKNR